MRFAFVITLIAMWTADSIELDACGDKFVRVGRSARFRRYAAAFPTNILIYKPVNSTSAGMKEFEALLKRAGHKPVVVERSASIPQVVAAAQYDLVIADYSDAARIERELPAGVPKPELLPILYKPSKAVEAQAEKEYACLIRPHAMTKYDALAEIDRVMRLKTKSTSAAGR